MTPDLVNGAFEFSGAAMLALNVRQLWRDRCVAGVHWGSTLFFVAWGLWNLFYYPSLAQWASFAGGVALVLINLAWLLSLWIITSQQRSAKRHFGEPVRIWRSRHERLDQANKTGVGEKHTIAQMLADIETQRATLPSEERAELKRLELIAQRESWIRAMAPCEHGMADFEDCIQCRGEPA